MELFGFNQPKKPDPVLIQGIVLFIFANFDNNNIISTSREKEKVIIISKDTWCC
jgi:hypothetical protein